MADQYFVLTGVKRSGTMFLATTLNQHPDAEVRHEPFCPQGYHKRRAYVPKERCWPQAFEAWRILDAPVVGMASCYATYYPIEIQKAVHPYWGFLWRDPLELAASIAGHGANQSLDFVKQQGVSNLERLLADVDRCLSILSEARVTVEHWSFSDYTRRDGFIRLAARLGLEMEFDFQLGLRNAQQGSCPDPAEWPQITRARVIALVRKLPHVHAGYKAAGVEIDLLGRIT